MKKYLLALLFMLLSGPAWSAPLGLKFIGNGANNSDWDMVELPQSAANLLKGQTTFTIEFSIYLETYDNSKPVILFCMEDGGAICNDAWYLHEDKLKVDLEVSPGFHPSSSNPLSLSTSTWYHLTYVFNNGTWSFFLDGVAVGTAVDTSNSGAKYTTTPTSQRANIYLGNYDASQLGGAFAANFRVDEFRIWSDVRSAAELIANKDSEIASDAAGLVGYWKLNEIDASDGASVVDSQTNTTQSNGRMGISIAGGFDPTSAVGIVTAAVSNTAPIITLPSSPIVNEDDINVAIANDINIADADTDNQTVTLTITGGTVSIGTANLSFTTGDGTDDNSMIFSGTLANINTALDAMIFTPSLNLNGTNAGSIQIATTDGYGGSDDDTLQFDISAVNDAPVNTLPSSPTVNEDDLNVAISDAINIADIESDNQTVTLTITGGTVSIGTSGLSFTTGDGADDSSMVFSGTLANINTALDAMTFTPTPNLNGNNAGSVQIATNDGNSGADNDTLQFDITSVNDAPTVINPIADQSAKVGNVFSFLPPTDVFTDADNDTLTISITGLPTWLMFTGTEYSGTPSSADVGTSAITVTANDNNGGTVNDILTLTVAPNNAPVITGTPITTVAEDATYSFTPTVTDADSGDTKTFSISNKPTWAEFDTVTGLLSGTPTNSHVGTTSNIIITVTDKIGAQASLAAFSLTVTNENDAPVITGSPATTIAEDVAYSFTPTVTDVDSDDTKTFSISSKPSWATFSTATGLLSGTPTNDNIGTTSNIIITVTDGSAATASLSGFSLTVTNENDAPVISGTPATTVAEDATYSFTPTVTDVDSDDTKTFSISSKPSWATFSTATGLLSGTPTNDNIGTTSNIIITVTDGSAATASLSGFNLTVTNENDAPVITGSPATTIAEDVAYSFTPTVTDVDSDDTKTFSISSKPSWATFSTITGVLSGTPTNDDVGVTSGIVITVKDSSNATASLSGFNLTVTNENDAPVISGTPATTVAEDAAYSFTPTVTDVDSGDTKTFSINNKPSWAAFSTATGLLSGTPTNDNIGTTSNIIITVTDGSAATASLSGFNLTVTNENDAPVITGSPATTIAEDVAYSFTPTVTDVDSGDTKTFSINNKPSWAAFSTATGLLSGTPTNDNIGTTSNIIITVTDGSAATASLSGFNLTVTNENDAPVITGSPATTIAEDVAYSFTPTVTDVDSGDTKTFSINNKPSWVTFSTTTGALSGTPTNDDVGVTSGIVITVKDSSNATASLSGFNLTVTNENDAPVISGTPATTVAEDAAYSFTPTVTDVDSDDTKTFSISSKPSWATFSTATGLLSGTPTNDNIGTTSNIIITVTDGSAATASLSGFNLTVTNENDAPVITGSPATTIAEDVAYSFTPTVTDVDSGDTKTFSINNKPSWAAFSTATGLLSGTPTNDNIGTTSNIIITVTDGSAATASLSGFNLTVTNENDAPVITGSPATTIAEDVAYSFTPTVTDVDSGDTKAFSINNKPSWVTFSTTTGALSGTPTNDDVGVTSGIVITVKDSSNATASLSGFNLTVTNENDAPVITGSPATTIAEDVAYSFTPTVTDVDSGDTKTFSINNKPSWAAFSTATGLLSGTPTNDNIGTTSNIIITVTDGSAVTASLSGFNLTVTNENDAPVISGTPATTIAEDAVYSFTPTVIDVDSGDTKVFTITNKPSWATFNTITGELSGTPTNTHVGTTSSIVITVKDGSNVTDDLAAFSIEVTNVNDAPVISASPITLAVAGVAYGFTASATDVDNTPAELTYSLSNQPSWLTINAISGVVSGTPTAAEVDVTTSNITVSVSDGSASDSLSFSIAVDGDLDGDQIGDDVDSDIDGDGMSNEFELANGLEPLDASDASLDLDGDGVTNLDEYLAGTDPTRDDYAPVFTAPEDLIGDLAVNATGLFTKVSLVVPTVEDGKDGILLAQYDLFACVSEDDAVGKSAQTHFSPGCYNILWSAVDSAGNNANLTQKLHVIPLVEFSKNQDTAEEGEVSFDIILNGQAAIYPVTIPFTISGTAVNPEDHNLTDRSVSLQKITGAVKGETTATVTFDVRDDGVGEGTENITVTMNQPTNAVIGAKDSHTITIYEENVAPTVRFSATATVTENSVIKRIIHNDDDEFTIHAVVADPNTGDNHSYDWSSSDGALGDIDSTNSLFTINPADLATGSYKLVVQISDGEKTAMVETSLRVIKDVIALGSSDSDGDGISDESEGLTDSDLDGIPDYLDHIALASNVIQEIRSESAGEVINSQAFLMETEAGLSLRLGHVAFNSGSTSQTGNEAGSSVSAENIAEFHEVGSGVAEELTRYNFDNGIFNFIVDDLPVAGQSVNIVVAQFKAIPADAIYRKLMPTGWVDFTENANNQLSSAPGEKGYCPPPGNVAYVAGLRLDHWCVQLTIEDGGPNDADGEINGAVNDPGGVATALFEPIEVTTKGKGGAGSMSESLVILLGLLALARGVMQSKTGTTYWRVLQYSLIAMAIMLKSAQAADSTLAENTLVSTTATVVTATPIDQEHQGVTTPTTTMALEKTTQKRFYIGMSVLAVKSEERNDDFERELTQLGLDAQVSQSDLSRPGFRGYIGLQTTPWLAFELGYVNLGLVETTLTGQAIDANGYLDSAQQVYPVTADAGVLDMIFNLALTDHISGVLQVGKMRWASKYELSSGAITREFDDSGWGTHYGAGVEVDFVTALPVYFGWNRYDFANNHVDAWEFGIKYRF